MKKIIITNAVLLCFIKLSLLPCFGQGKYPTAIKLGEPAPPFKASYWLRGKPIEHFEKGQVYVLEFFATWCHYCIEAMPHLSELNTQYAGKVRFIGIDVQEATPWGQDPITYNRKHLNDFITTGMGKVMNYDLCRDTKDGYMSKNWVTAQGLYGYDGEGIPFTAIVDKNGYIAWVGHPYLNGEMEKALGQIVTGNFDVSQFIDSCNQKKAAIQQAETDHNKKVKLALEDPILADMNHALDAKNYPLAIAAAYRAIQIDPKFYSITYIPRINMFKDLSVVDPAKSLTLLNKYEGKAIITRKDTTQMFLKDVAAVYGMEDGLPITLYEFSINTLRSQLTNPVLVIRHLKALANAYYKSGKAEMARKVVQHIIDQIKRHGQDPAEFEQLLVMYKQ